MGTRRTKTELDALYADNTSGDISALDLRDLVETLKQPWGERNFGSNAGLETVLVANGYLEATFPTTTINASSHSVGAAITGTDTDNGLRYTGTPTILAHVFCQFQFSTENDNLDVSIALYKYTSATTSVAISLPEFRMTPTLSGYAATVDPPTAYRQKTGSITGVTSGTSSPIVVTATAHGLTTGDQVTISGATAGFGGNGTFIVENTSVNTLTLLGSTHATAWASGGAWVEEDALGPRPRKATHSGSINQFMSLATNDEVKLYVKNADWVTSTHDDNIRIDNASIGLFGLGVV
jgi:hypothetical protein